MSWNTTFIRVVNKASLLLLLACHLQAITVQEAMDFYTSKNYFNNNSALSEGIEQALSQMDLIGRTNDWDIGYNPYGDTSLEDYLLNHIIDLSLENASSLAGIEKLEQLSELKLERSSVTDFSPLHQSNLYLLEYIKSDLSSLPSSILQISILNSLLLNENKFTEIPENLNGSQITYVDLETNLLDLGDSATISKINELIQSGIQVDYENQFPQFLLNLSQKIATQPSSSNAKENFLHGLELLISIFEEESFKQLVLKSGEVKDIFSDFTLADLHSNIETYEDETGEVDQSADINDIEKFLKYDMVYKLDICMEFLEIAYNLGGEFSIDQTYTGSTDEVRVDQGDILMCLAIAEGLQGFLQFMTSYKWAHNIRDAETLEDMDQLSMETILKDKKLLTLQSSSQMSSARESFIRAVDYYNDAIAIIDQRVGTDSLFTFHEEDREEKDNITADLAEFQSALTSQSYTLDDDDFIGDKAIINPDALFSGRFDPINQLPQSEAGFLSVIGDRFTTPTVDDPTFGGFLPNWDQQYLTEKLNEWEMLDTNISALSSTKAVPSHNNWSYSGWFGYFLRPPGETDDSEFFAYHQYLGWIGVVSSDLSSTWILDISNDSQNDVWLWTKPTIFPFLYNENLEKWHYLSDNGKLYIWDAESFQWE